ncbi:hypothetical protein HDU87_005973 [Geranomyces variabilis]|uniref:Uncharacterized protein n=1 Tax=Geranomyces variabilis TaxID=109894 RepID=A0AAD5TV11_9FUNG|nr:hypothetical protein HDU87_005973 [Geranomyces variabilis]
MCISFFVLAHKKYKLVLCLNRDEYLDRAATRAHFWAEIGAPAVLAGTDEGRVKAQDSFGTAPSDDTPDIGVSTPRAGGGGGGEKPKPPPTTPAAAAADRTRHGTWAGFNVSTGHFAFLTNFREHPRLINPDALTRGYLVRDFLLADGGDHAEAYVKALHNDQLKYNGFNFVAGSVGAGDKKPEGWYCGNRGGARDAPPMCLTPGVVYGLSNGVLVDGASDWPKVERGKRLLQEVLAEEENTANTHALITQLLTLLADKTTYPDDALPTNMYSHALEQALCPICVDRERTPNAQYGTRLHTVMLVDNENHGWFVEVDRYPRPGTGPGRLDFEFVVGGSSK